MFLFNLQNRLARLKPPALAFAAPQILRLLARLWRHIGRKRRNKLFLVIFLTIASSFAEVVSIGAVLPFLGVLTAPQLVFEHPAAQYFVKSFGITAADQLLLPFAVGFCLATVLAGGMRLLLLWTNTRLSLAMGNDLSNDIFCRTLYQPYVVHAARNSNAIIDVVASKVFVVISNIILPVLTLISSCIVLIVILATLLFVNAGIALGTFGGFGLIYLIIMWLTRRKSWSNSQKIAHNSTQLIKTLQEGLGGIRDILIDGSQGTFCRIFQDAAGRLHCSHGSNVIISSSPRIGVEMLGMVLISMVAYGMTRDPDGIPMAVPVLGALALGAQRQLPLLQQAYAAIVAIRGGQASLMDTLKLLDQPLPDYADQPAPSPLLFVRQIRLKNLSFRYGPQLPFVLDDVDLIIPKGSRIGFIGITGSGKSTLLDVIMGLLEPTAGLLEVDGQPVVAKNCRAWQAHIAHVPQTIFLADSSIEENIAFGVPGPLIDRERVRHAARQAQIAGTIEALPNGYRTLVGERGVRLSGGQRQRIGIARALYKQADVIIFDEATSALDNETELAVMQAIEGLSQDLTILIIAHRSTTLKGCTQVVELRGGRIVGLGSYRDMVESRIA